ncbi:uncharacterized protein [Asterias amurensis]|uniref:uncharacterized protein n=1 Tax=Asterias amurensis TaxID=7602 RepID=UPI003AB109CF
MKIKSKTFLVIMAGFLFGLGASGSSSFGDFVSEAFLTDDAQLTYEGRKITYRASPRRNAFPVFYVGKAVDQASGITATAGETENFSHSEDASQKAVAKLLAVLRERGLLLDQVQKTLLDSSPTNIVPVEPEPKVPKPQPSATPEQVDQEQDSDDSSRQPEDNGQDSNSVSIPPLSEPGCESSQDKKETGGGLEEPHCEERNQDQVPDEECRKSDPQPDYPGSDEPEEDQELLDGYAGWWSMRTLMTVAVATIVALGSCYFLDRYQLLPGNVSMLLSAIFSIAVAGTFGTKILGVLFNTLSKGVQKAINVTLKLSKSFSNLQGVLQPIGAVFEVVPDCKGSYAAYVMKQSHPTTDMLAPKYNYQLTSTCKGIAFILNNFDFDESERKGSEIDLSNVKHLFLELGYRIVVHENLSGKKIVECFQHFADMFNKTSYDSAVVVLMSHGDTGVILGTDLVKVKLRDLERELEGDKCQGLNGKPKMFFVQACRGDHPIIAPVVADRPSPDVPLGEEWDYPESLECVPDNDFMTQTADRADAHIAFSTTEGHWSLRSEVIGSFFVQALCEVFFANAHRDNLDTLMNKVAYRVDRMKGRLFDHATLKWIIVKQTPECIKRGMRKSLYFLPKYTAEKIAT